MIEFDAIEVEGQVLPIPNAPVEGSEGAQAVAALRERFAGQITRVRYPFRPYTVGERFDAQRESTKLVDGSPRLDFDELTMRLTALSLGLTLEAVRGMNPRLYRRLASEVYVRTEPDVDRVDFFGDWLTSLAPVPTPAEARETHP